MKSSHFVATNITMSFLKYENFLFIRFDLFTNQNFRMILIFIFAQVKKAEDFPIGSFCEAHCGAQLNCGHCCKRNCHTQGSHTDPCLEKVTKVLACGHDQLAVCSKRDNITRCFHPVTLTVSPCMHEKQVPCWQSSSHDVKCEFPMEKILPCGHIRELRCCDPPLQSACKTRVEIKLTCSHVTTTECGISILARSELKLFCNQLVRKPLSCGHSKMMACREDPMCIVCDRSTELVLNCGHVVEYICTGIAIDTSLFSCQIIVDRLLPCGHVQKSSCSSAKKRICQQEVERMGKCGHQIKTYCSNTSPICVHEMGKMLLCGHMASVLCSQAIDTVTCTADVEVILPRCSHVQSVPCHISRCEELLNLWICGAESLKMLKCGHEMQLPCCKEIDNTIECLTDVNYTLPCCHLVTIPCHSIEEKIQEKCKMQCEAFLNCQHLCTLPCHDNSKAHYCTLLMKKKLICGHELVTI